MSTDKKLNKLVINTLTEEQYKNATKNEDELYLTPDTTEDDLEKINSSIPTDIGIKDNKLGLLHDTKWLTNQGAINLQDFEYDSTTNTLKPKSGGGGIPVINANSSDFKNFTLEVEPTTDYFILNMLDVAYLYMSKYDDGLLLYIGSIISIDATPIILSAQYNASSKQGTFIISELFKKSSLFGKHTILVPSDSSDSNIDLYVHNIVMKDAEDNTQKQLFITINSSSNLVVDSFTDLNTLLGTTKRTMPCNGFVAPTSSGCPCIQALDWQGSYASSKYLTNNNSTNNLSDFKVIKDDVTTI